ncbi:DUF3857 and transglutaminase domain-containing protein [Flavobacteriaceae bacterium TP-CH-4]|uniref:DUF3857 and transglutaminase domain-containing protein n=1 Tax=Pelagihabitans pacificus TaxID=2696054 RepID=A0A967E7R8_9FLAO|nr:DUF3857 domain-containing protein [Pelagihabitans pacificus]NHF60915.1 DUF3857 and transglutaminase domain-containing protein [Pelagihabitans pacificus]
MKHFPFPLLATCLFVVNGLFAQDFKFGKVSKAELEEKTHPRDTAAVAAYLYKYRRTYFDYVNGQGFQLNTDVHERVKIYDPAGFDYATKKIRLYEDGSDRETISGLKAYTYNLEGGKVKDVKLGKDGEFTMELTESWYEKSFTMPNLKEGSVIEYKYKISSPFIAQVDEFVFQHDIPVNKLEASMEMPEYFNYRVNTKGFLSVVPKVENTLKTVNIAQKVATGNWIGPRSTTEQGTINYRITIAHYNLENIPALHEEPHVGSIDNYRSGMKYELSYTKFPNSPMKQYATDWEAVVKSIYENPGFGAELKKTGYFEDEIDPLVAAATTDVEKLAIIFSFIKSKVKWNGFYGKYTSDGVKKAFKERTGNVAEINLMLTSMLRYAGLDANPVLVSTRKHGIPIFPTREGYDYVICGVQLQGGTVLLDATHAYSTPNVLPFRTLNWEGRIIKKDGSSSLVDLYPQENSSKKIFCSAVMEENGDVNGKIRISYTNHDAIQFREGYNETNEEDYLEKLENENGGIEIDNFNVKNRNDLSKAAVTSYEYYDEGAFDVVADKIYFSPMLFLRTTENPFKLEKREFPVDFGYPSGRSVISSINLPAGYKVETLPEPMAMAMPDALGSFKYEIIDKGNMIQLKVSSEINQPIIPSVYYGSLKEYYKKMIEKMNEKVVLSKV